MSNENNKPIFYIDKKIVNMTHKCNKNNSCMINGHLCSAVCEVEAKNDMKCIILECKTNEKCSYKIQSEDHKYICTCPVRYEIFKKYNK